MYYHIIADIPQCNHQYLMWDTSEYTTFRQMITNQVGSVSEILAEKWHVFENLAYTGVILLAESHFSIHTWPELGICKFDLFTCGSASPLTPSIELARTLTGELDVEKYLRIIER